MTSADGEPHALIGPQHGHAVRPSLTRMPRKRALFAVDTYFRESLEDVERVAGAADAVHDCGALLLKAEASAMRLLEPALDWLLERGARIVAADLCQLTRRTTRAMWQYQWNVATRDRRDLADMMLKAGPSLSLIVRLPPDPVPAAVRLSEWKGPADPARRLPDQLRYRLGPQNFLINYVHAADEPADVIREVGILFTPERRLAIYEAAVAGVDAEADARRLIAELYDRIPARDLTFDTLHARLARAVEPDPVLRERLAAAAAGADRDWRGLCRMLDDAGIGLDRWDSIVLGTTLMEHTEPGLDQILGGVSGVEWPGWLAGAATTVGER